MGPNATSEIASQLRLRESQVQGTLDLLRQGNTVAYLARYCKEATGGLKRKTITAIVDLHDRLSALEIRKKAVLQAIDEQGQLTDELRKAIGLAAQPWLVEDLYLPFRPQGHTAAVLARDRGLEPLAELILSGRGERRIEDLAANFIHHDREVHTTTDALAGASHIIAERYSTNARLRQKVRDTVWARGVLRSSKGPHADEQFKEFRDYFNFSEPVKSLPPHRVLAVNRGQRKKALKITVEVPMDELLEQCRLLTIPEEHPFAEFLQGCLADSLRRLVVADISREVRHELTGRAELHAIDVFASNLQGILMTPAVPSLRVLAVDPGFRSGCKVVALDGDGRLLGETIVYPHEPQKRWDEAKTALAEVLRKYRIDAIAIGNGTGSHETEKLITEALAENDLAIKYSLVSEAGASAYAAGQLAREEFPNLDAALRGTVSIGRRLQDPISEFVKVDPRCIGVGLYQHDVNQDLLKKHLDQVLYDCVNEVGADPNRANVALLARISGLNETLARNIVARRDESGPFRSREQLKTIDGIDENVFRQSAGFLRIFGGDNPLDRTRIHPKDYQLAQRILRHFGYSEADLARPGGLPGLREKLQGLSLEKLSVELEAGIPTLSDLLYCLEFPEHDPRDNRPPPIFKTEMMRLEDLKPGMWLKGTIRNVVDFGAFVDIGVREDGLVHVSQFSSRYIKNPVDFVHVGQTVDVRIMSIDRDRQRIALSMIQIHDHQRTAPQHPHRPSAQTGD